MKRKYSGFTLRDAMQLIPAENLTPWMLHAPARPLSDFLREGLLGFQPPSMRSRTEFAVA